MRAPGCQTPQTGCPRICQQRQVHRLHDVPRSPLEEATTAAERRWLRKRGRRGCQTSQSRRCAAWAPAARAETQSPAAAASSPAASLVGTPAQASPLYVPLQSPKVQDGRQVIHTGAYVKEYLNARYKSKHQALRTRARPPLYGTPAARCHPGPGASPPARAQSSSARTRARASAASCQAPAITHQGR